MIPIKTHIRESAHIRSLEEYQTLYRKSIDHPEQFWGAQARQRLHWFHAFEEVLRADASSADFSWFAGGKLNACYNAVDRHVRTRGNHTALIWVADDPGCYLHITFQQVEQQVCRMANVLKSFGVGRGDRVVLYMPMIPELVYAMLACARIGAVHSAVFAGFSAEALRDRVLNAGAKLVITADEGRRGGRPIPLKTITDRALEGLSSVRTVLVAERAKALVPMQFGRDYWLHEVMASERAVCPVEWMDSEDPLFILYTSGSTGRPKGVMHTTAGYLLYAAMTHQLVFDIHPSDVWLCAADIGWVTGHSYIVYGPLCNGVTTVLFESTPTYPDAGRYWQVVDDLKVTGLYTAPTALRALMREGDAPVKRYSRASLKILGSVGEPINPEVWRWYHDVVGEGRCTVVDTWWQTETGGIQIAPLPGVTPCKPGSATLPFFGVDPVIVDPGGEILEGAGASGNLCLRRPWPGMARTLFGDHQRFKETYFSAYPGLYFTGDGCIRDEDGYYWITGRVDDVINVSGHRLGTAEIESALVAHEAVAEAAVVGFPHELKGTGIYAYVHVVPGYEEWDAEELSGLLKAQVRSAIGAIATPDRIQIVPGLPKTRSGKIMRRILRKIAQGVYTELGDLTTLADPSVVEALIEGHQQLHPL